MEGTAGRRLWIILIASTTALILDASILKMMLMFPTKWTFARTESHLTKNAKNAKPTQNLAVGEMSSTLKVNNDRQAQDAGKVTV